GARRAPARGGWDAGPAGGAPGAQRLPSPALAGADRGPGPVPGLGGDRGGRAGRCGAPAGGRVLLGHGPAPWYAYRSRARRSRSGTSPGFSVVTRIIARIASARGTRGTPRATAAESAHWVSCRYSSGLRSRVTRTGLDRMAVRPAGGAPGSVRLAAAAAICALRCS